MAKKKVPENTTIIKKEDRALETNGKRLIDRFDTMVEVTEDSFIFTILGEDRADFEKLYADSYEFRKENGNRLPDSFLLKALELTGGNKSRAAKLIGVGRDIFYARARENPEFQEKIDMIKNEKLDFAEDKAWEHIVQGNPGMIQFYLARMGRSRGWGNSVELTGSKEKPVNININIGDNDDSDFG